MFEIRLAHKDDIPAIQSLIKRSANELSKGFYTAEQIALLSQEVFGVDTKLIDDQTYYVATAKQDGKILACGGWSKRTTIFGGDQMANKTDTLLDHSKDAAKIRAFFCDPDFAGKGIAKALFKRSITDLAKSGFSEVEWYSTLTGVNFYASLGGKKIKDIEYTLSNGTTVTFVHMKKSVFDNTLASGTMRFKNKSDGVYFSFNDRAYLFNTRKITLPIKHGNSTARQIRVPRAKMITMYALYRNTIFDACIQKAELAQDIKNKPMQFAEDEALGKIMTAYSDDNKGLYRYVMAAALEAIKNSNTPKKIKTYLAYENVDGKSQHVGFVHFTEMVIHGNPIVYIAEAGVSKRGRGIGCRLMECVISHYPAGTEFFILTRIFNTEAKTLYNTRLKFQPLDENLIAELGYSKEKYVGYRHVSTKEEITEIINKQESRIVRPNISSSI